MRESKILFFLGSIGLILLINCTKNIAQDFILTRDNQLIQCKITIDSPAFIQYTKDGRIIKRARSLVADHAILQKRKANILEIIDTQGLRLRGTFLYADKDSVYLWRGRKVYHPKKGAFLAVGINEIDKMVIVRKGDFWKGFGIGSLVGLTAGFVYMGIDDHDWFKPMGIVAASAIFYGLVGASISSQKEDHFQFNNQSVDTRFDHDLMKENTMLLTPPINSMGRDTTRTNWVSRKRTLYKSETDKPKLRWYWSFIKFEQPTPQLHAGNASVPTVVLSN